MLVDERATILLTTQYLEEADRLADDIVVIDHGRVIARGDARELKRAGGRRPARASSLVAADDLDAAAAHLARIAGAAPRSIDHARSVLAPTDGGVRRLATLAGALPTAASRSRTSASASRRSTTCS